MAKRLTPGTGRTSKIFNQARDGRASAAEYMQTDLWAIESILRVELMTSRVVDPCCGDGRMADAARRHGYHAIATDLHAWGGGQPGVDFLQPNDLLEKAVPGSTVFMNPPFSLSCQFVDRARQLGARKIVCFQRSVWRESRDRKEWWEAHPPARIYQCGDRAYCWYGTIPLELRKGGANQPHSWFVWEVGHPPGTVLGAIWDTNKKTRTKKP